MDAVQPICVVSAFKDISSHGSTDCAVHSKQQRKSLTLALSPAGPHTKSPVDLSSSLMRLFLSDMFTVRHVMCYLLQRGTSDIRNFLAKRLLLYSPEEVDFYLPQLLILYHQGSGKCIAPYLSHRISNSPRVATEMAWLLDTINSSSPMKEKSKLVKLSPLADDLTPLSTASPKGLILEGTVSPEHEDDPLSRDSSTTPPSLDNDDVVLVEEEEEKVGDGQSCVCTEDDTAKTTETHLTRHKRSTSDLPYLSGIEARQTLLDTVTFKDAAEPSQITDVPRTPREKLTAGLYDLESPRHRHRPPWMLHLGVGGASVYSQTSRSDTQLCRTRCPPPVSFSTDLLSLPPPQTSQLPHLSQALLDLLEDADSPTDQLIGICKTQWDFVNALLSISRRLTGFTCKEQRTGHLQAELYKLNLGLPARVWLPVEKTEHVVLRIPPAAAVCLNSAEKAPYLIYVEVLVCADISRVRLPRRTDPGSAFTQACNLSSRCRRLYSSSQAVNSTNCELSPPSSKLSVGVACAIAAPDVLSLFSDSGESCGGGCGGVGESCSSPLGEEEGGEAEAEAEEEEHHGKTTTASEVVYVNAKEIRRRLEENAACQPQRTFKLDPVDPSAAVLKEPLQQKARRIQESSPWGHLPGWRLSAAIVKVGDDLRQEQLAYQLLRLLKDIWTAEKLDLWLRPLNIVVTSSDSGLIELVQDTVSLHQIRRHAKMSLRDYIIRENGLPNTEGFLTAQKNFVESCAAYCIVGYLFQVKDRHNGNILIDKEGHVIHIDYGFMLSASPGRNLGFETSPFKLTGEQVELMGGVDSDMFLYYQNLILKGLISARKHMDDLVLLVEMALSGYPHLPIFTTSASSRTQTVHATIQSLRQRFLLTSTEKYLERFVKQMIQSSLNSFTTRLYDNYQYYANGIQ